MSSLPIENKGSFRTGIYFVFKDADNIITFWGSCFSGKEIVYLNGNNVAESRRMKMDAEHKFKDEAGNAYTIKLQTINALKGIIECRLYKNEIQIGGYQCRYRFGSIWNKKFLSLLFGGSVLIGIAGGLDLLTVPMMGICLGVLLVINFLLFENEAFEFSSI